MIVRFKFRLVWIHCLRSQRPDHPTAVYTAETAVLKYMHPDVQYYYILVILILFINSTDCTGVEF